MIFKVSGLHTGVLDLARHPFQVMRNFPDVRRSNSHIGQHNSDIVQDLKCGNLYDVSILIHKSFVQFKEGGAEDVIFSVDLAANIML
jgi:hypothetical protein